MYERKVIQFMSEITSPFDKYYEEYEEWFTENEFVYKSELKAVEHFIPGNKDGLEIGIGSGKFAKPLGIKTGIEPSSKMRELAQERGLKVFDGVGESLDFEDGSFDFVLMVTTICFLDDVKKAFKEVKRVLKKNGRFIIGFVDEKSPLGQTYSEKKDNSVFYKDAVFYSTDDVLSLLKEFNFINIEVVQTVFGDLSEINKVQNFKEGYGEGGFVVIKAERDV